MTSFFSMPKPRRFCHKYIYVDERKERLAAMEKEARIRAGNEKAGMEEARKRLHASFMSNMRHVDSRKDYRQNVYLMMNIAIVVIIIFILYVVWRMLLSM